MNLGLEKIILCADIGGTNANFSIVGVREKMPEILLLSRERTPSGKEFPGVVNDFLAYAASQGFTPEDACLAVAGPVEMEKGRRRVKMTNVQLIVDSENLIEHTPLKHVEIVNDFEAISYATTLLSQEDYVTLNRGRSSEREVRAVIGAGTGLGKSILYFDEHLLCYVALPSEGGHSDLPVLNEEEMELAEFVRKKTGVRTQITYEDVLSGRGLENIYEFLHTKKHPNSPSDLSAEEMSERRKEDPCSRETFQWFVNFYARCARNFVLDVFATGGLYIAGGIAGKNVDLFSQFMSGFAENDTYGDLLRAIPICLITNYDVSLIGAARAFIVRDLLKRDR